MKFLFTLLLMVAVSTSVLSQTDLSKELLAAGSKQSTELKSGSWYTEAGKKIKEKEYEIKWKTELGEYVAVNRKNRIGFFFREDGYRVLSFATTSGNSKNWEYNFRLKNISRGDNKLSQTSLAKTSQSGNELVYHYAQYAVEYLNDTNGMRQNFIINERPNGQGPLEIHIGLQGDLQTSVEGGKKLILSSVQQDKKVVAMQYDQLKVWDRNHNLLDASMQLKDGGQTLVISVNDANAEYPVTVDPLNHTPDWTDNGLGILPALDVLYGMSVSDAGDVNNDGYDDIIVGAPANIDVLSSSVIASAGQAFIYLGSATGLSASPDITLQSSVVINALFGYSVSSAGDINNDGYDDVIVGAPADNVTINFGIPFGSITNNIGKVYVYYGNSNPAAIPGSAINVHLTAGDFNPLTFGLTINPLFGYSISGAGDVNNDGYDDIIVGSPAYTDLGTLTLGGRATVYLGSSGGLNTGSPIHRNGGLLSNILFGFSVSGAGDMNNDGADEVLIGAPGALTLLPGLVGQAYVYTGISAPTPGGISSSPVTYSDGALLKTLFGFSVSNAGDVNNDGYDDIVVGQPATLSLSALVTVGKASIFFGSATLSNKFTDDISLVSPRDPDILGLVDGNLLFGFSVSGGKDMDCDGLDDVIIGEPGGTGLLGLTGINALGGQAYIYYGRNIVGPNSAAGWDLKETNSLVVANLLGYSVSPAGDVNGDGKSEILVGASNGTLDLTNIITGLLNFTFVQSVGSAYVHNGCLLPTLFTLPVTINWFKGSLQGNTVLLQWQTASEQNADHFDVERSVDGVHYEKIGEVNASGDSNSPVDYNFTDNSPVKGTNLYRLKIVDRDARFKHSNIVTIRIDNIGFVKLRSTVVSSNFTLDFNNAAKGEYIIDLISMDGRVIQSNTERITTDHSSRTININNASAKGIFMLSVRKSGSAERYSAQLLIQ